MDPQKAADLRRTLREISGTPLENLDTAAAKEMLERLGIAVDDATDPGELWRQYEALQPAVVAAALDPDAEASRVVDPVFDAAMARLGGSVTLEGLAAEQPGIRAIVATRIIDGLVDEGGWVSVLTGRQLWLVAAAIDGYRLLGLSEHAGIAIVAAERGHDPAADAEAEDAYWTQLEGRWFDLPSPEAARAAYVRAHPEGR